MSFSDGVKEQLEKDRDDHAAARKALRDERRKQVALEVSSPDKRRDAASEYLDGFDLRGRPRKMPTMLITLLRNNSKLAIRCLVEAMGATNKDGTADHGTRVDAAERILNRVYGKPTMAITGADGAALQAAVIILPAPSEDD